MSTVNVYIAIIEDYKDNTLLPSYIGDISNERVLREKRAAYGLLKAAGVDITKCSKTENGKPIHPDICFSISHCKELCAVAVSEDNVGVDIEAEIDDDRSKRIRQRILHKNEDPDTEVTLLWTRKEAVFKLKGDKAFIGSEIDTTAYHTLSKTLRANSSYTVTVAAEKDFEINLKIM